MSSYQNLTPPSSLFPGDVGFSFNNEAFPGGAQAGSQFALTTPGVTRPKQVSPCAGKRSLVRRRQP